MVKKIKLNEDGSPKGYTKLTESQFDEIYQSVGNSDGKLKIIDNGKEITFYVLTKFLLI